MAMQYLGIIDHYEVYIQRKKNVPFAASEAWKVYCGGGSGGVGGGGAAHVSGGGPGLPELDYFGVVRLPEDIFEVDGFVKAFKCLHGLDQLVIRFVSIKELDHFELRPVRYKGLDDEIQE